LYKFIHFNLFPQSLALRLGNLGFEGGLLWVC